MRRAGPWLGEVGSAVLRLRFVPNLSREVVDCVVLGLLGVVVGWGLVEVIVR